MAPSATIGILALLMLAPGRGDRVRAAPPSATSAVSHCALEMGGKGKNIFPSVMSGMAYRADGEWEAITILRPGDKGAYVITGKQTAYFEAGLSDCVTPPGFKPLIIGALVPWDANGFRTNAGKGWDEFLPLRGACPKNTVTMNRSFDNAHPDPQFLSAFRDALSWSHASHPPDPKTVPPQAMSDVERAQLAARFKGVSAIFAEVTAQCRGVIDGTAFAAPSGGGSGPKTAAPADAE